MALILSRQIGQVIFANEHQVTLVSHNLTPTGDKVATVVVKSPDGKEVESTLSLKEDNRAVISSEPYAAVSLGNCTKNAARLRFHGERDEVTFLRAEIKGD